MRILLVGEYSRLHNSLKEGLLELGHDVVLLGMSDGFKNFPVDIEISRRYTSGIKKKLKNVIYKLTGYDLESRQVKNQILNSQNKASGFDVIQFINEAPFGCTANIEKQIFDVLHSWNSNSFLLSCGTDYLSVAYAFNENYRYSIFTSFKKHTDTKHSDSYGVKFLKPEFEALHNHIYSSIEGVIASDIDYHLPLLGHPKYLGLAPNPVNTNKIELNPIDISGKIVIFHGINSMHYYKKGNDLFEHALSVISKKYSDKVEIITAKDLPYTEYIKSYNEAHILLDQVYAYDQGYNALEAMAKGKVVFTGAEQEWLDYYKMKKDMVVINALPEVSSIIEKLVWLIENPNQIVQIGRNARQFVENHHNYIKCADRYLELWQSKLKQ